MSLTDQIMGALGRIVRDGLRTAARPSRRRPAAVRPSARYPGDYRRLPRVTYAPHPGKLPDPGEVVWTWVPFEEDHSQGKDRPVLLVGRDGDWLLGLPMTSVDHDRDVAQEASEGRFWHDIGRGPWDSSGRPSEVRINRVVRVRPEAVRRVTGKVSQAVFAEVAAAMTQHLR